MKNNYRKKPVIIQAIQYDGDNYDEIIYNFPGIISGLRDDLRIDIKTLEGVMTAEIGDYIIRGIKGEFYPCKKDIFNLTYDPVDE